MAGSKWLRDVDRIHFKFDQNTGLFAVIAIHHLEMGPGLGGSRCLTYDSEVAAIIDAIALAKMMTLKMAITGMPFTGAKAVLMKPDKIIDRAAYFQSFGEFVEELNGQFVTGCDSGVFQSDMREAKKCCHHITAVPKRVGGTDYLIDFTVLSVIRCLEVAVAHKLKKNSLDGLHVAIQGVGKVGFRLLNELIERGVELTITDLNWHKVLAYQKQFKVAAVAPNEIYSVDCDVFAPCALGGILNRNTVPKISADIVCGAANNQLASEDMPEMLQARNILYIPDFIANVGGAIFAAADHLKRPIKEVREQINKTLYQQVTEIIRAARESNKTTQQTALEIAQQLIHNKHLREHWSANSRLN